MTTSQAIYDAFEERSWSALARRSRDQGREFVIGRREGPYVWNLEGTRRLLDCTLTGGVHSLGHRNPQLLATLRGALDEGLDGGLWVFPTPQMLTLQDALAAVAPDPSLNRSVITLSSTASIDLAVQAAALHTGRPHVLAYRHGYHGHAGFAAMVTGSQEEGIIDFYGLPNTVGRFFERYGDLDEITIALTPDVAAVILELFDYETWAPAAPDFLAGLASLCRERGALLIVDETRTGLGRSGRFWMCQHSGLAPDMLITGKGLSGGLYPASALLTTRAIYDGSINAHRYGFASSMGGNELSCVVASKVLEICGRPEFYAGIEALAARFEERFAELCLHYPTVFEPGTVLGGIVTLGTKTPAIAKAAAASLFISGVLCHSISSVPPARVKFYPVLTAGAAIADEIADALAAFARKHAI